MKIVLLAALGVSALITAADTPSAAVYKSESELIGSLNAATRDMLTSPISIDDRHRINLVRRTSAAGAVAHPGFAELHHIVSGSGTLVTGGTLVRATGGAAAAATIQNGQTRRVAKGDVVLIPPGMPHWYKDLDGTLTYLEVRWAEQ